MCSPCKKVVWKSKKTCWQASFFQDGGLAWFQVQNQKIQCKQKFSQLISQVGLWASLSCCLQLRYLFFTFPFGCGKKLMTSIHSNFCCFFVLQVGKMSFILLHTSLCSPAGHFVRLPFGVMAGSLWIPTENQKSPQTWDLQSHVISTKSFDPLWIRFTDKSSSRRLAGSQQWSESCKSSVFSFSLVCGAEMQSSHNVSTYCNLHFSLCVCVRRHHQDKCKVNVISLANKWIYLYYCDLAWRQ